MTARYNRAVANAPESRRAFEQLDNGAPIADKAIWLAEIEAAESQRQQDPTAMDVMQSRIKGGATLKEVMADICSRDPSINSAGIGDDGTATDWLLEGLNIEDEQYDIFQIFIYKVLIPSKQDSGAAISSSCRPGTVSG